MAAGDGELEKSGNFLQRGEASLNFIGPCRSSMKLCRANGSCSSLSKSRRCLRAMRTRTYAEKERRGWRGVVALRSSNRFLAAGGEDGRARGRERKRKRGGGGGLDSARSTRFYRGRCLPVSDQLIFVASLSLVLVIKVGAGIWKLSTGGVNYRADGYSGASRRWKREVRGQETTDEELWRDEQQHEGGKRGVD